MGNRNSNEPDYYTLRELGFGKLGPVADSYGSGWQSRLGNVSKGHRFGVYQRSGMKASKPKKSCFRCKTLIYLVIIGVVSYYCIPWLIVKFDKKELYDNTTQTLMSKSQNYYNNAVNFLNRSYIDAKDFYQRHSNDSFV